ncbi:hypothetical protein ANSO36C_66210 (plasmid) [Nostoc cf. commune SO-36]|uniref:Uncharacterized protein n=1 Tax=Nostoc cf. commune SO-36 TaxID=449208 RepID=A0ABN6QEK8_NOSCO|nr:DUF2808 domain-containing protein [Nostoc commune]BDI20819.1 hypothetical protein ANSO36C_66210 [Nostoc cf. commune SO-36]
MKKKIIYATVAFTAATLALIFAGYAVAKTDDDIDPNVDNNLPFSPNAWRLVKHTFRINIPKNGKTISQLIIDVPSTVAVSNDIEVLDEEGQKINTNISVSGRQIIINFPKTVVYNSKLNVNLNKVKQPISGSASIYKFSVK